MESPFACFVLLDWSKGDYNIPPETVLAFMGEEQPMYNQATHHEIWEDEPVLQLLKRLTSTQTT